MKKFRTNPGHHDTDPMLHLRARHGAAGYGVYIMLINLISASPTRSIEADPDYLAYVLRADSTLVRSVLLDFGLFTISPDGLTATSPLITPPAQKATKPGTISYTPIVQTRAAHAVTQPMPMPMPMPMFPDFAYAATSASPVLTQPPPPATRSSPHPYGKAIALSPSLSEGSRAKSVAKLTGQGAGRLYL